MLKVHKKRGGVEAEEEIWGYVLGTQKERRGVEARKQEKKEGRGFGLEAYKARVRLMRAKKKERRKRRGSRRGQTEKWMGLKRENRRKENTVGVRAGGKQRKR